MVDRFESLIPSTETINKVKKEKMNGKKALPLIVIASMMLALIPSTIFSNAIVTGPFLNVSNGKKGDTIKVTGTGEPAGTTIQLYWDDVTHAWNGVNGLMNSTTVKSSGNYEIWFDVPEATNGAHYVWIKDSAANTFSALFTVNSYIKMTSSSGLPGDSITLNLYGFSGSIDVKIAYNNGNTPVPGWTPVTTVGTPYENLATGDGSTTGFTGTLANGLVKPGTVTVYVAGTAVGTDSGGDITGTTISSGSINYITGAVAITFTTAGTPANGAAINIGYGYYAFTAATLISLGRVTTNSVGSVQTSVTIPSTLTNPSTGAIEALDGDGVYYTATFNVGPTISITPTSAVSGSIIHVLGRGFPARFYIPTSHSSFRRHCTH